MDFEKMKNDYGDYNPILDLPDYIKPSTDLLKSKCLKKIFNDKGNGSFTTLTLPKSKENDIDINIDISNTGFTIVLGDSQLYFYKLFILNILLNAHPSEVKLMVINSKNTFFINLLEKIDRHFLSKIPSKENAISRDLKESMKSIDSIKMEIKDRLVLLEEANISNIQDYNESFKKRKLNPERGHRFFPILITLIDNLENLLRDNYDLFSLYELSKQGAKVGVHIFCFQLEKINLLNASLFFNKAFSMSFCRDEINETIDLYMNLDIGTNFIENNSLIIIDEVENFQEIISFISSQSAYPSPLILFEEPEPEVLNENEIDLFFTDAARIIVLHQQGSTSLLQRKLKLTFQRAAHIINQLEQKKIIGVANGTKAREVLFKDIITLDLYLASNNIF